MRMGSCRFGYRYGYRYLSLLGSLRHMHVINVGPYNVAANSMERDRQLSSARLSALSYECPSAVSFSPSAQMQYTASIPVAHHSPFSLCLLLVLLLLAVATYSDYFTLTSVHVCLSRSSGVLYRSSNADYAGKSSPHSVEASP